MIIIVVYFIVVYFTTTIKRIHAKDAASQNYNRMNYEKAQSQENALTKNQEPQVTIVQVVLYSTLNYWFMSPFSHERGHIHKPGKASNDYWEHVPFATGFGGHLSLKGRGHAVQFPKQSRVWVNMLD